jgi:hypothetical protein
LSEGKEAAKKRHNEQGQHEHPLLDRKGNQRIQEKAPRSQPIVDLMQFSRIVNRENYL